jgi:hypothetical protein
LSWLGLISNEELSSLANFVTESLWIGAAIFVVAMIVSAAIAFLIEKRKLNKPEKGEGG